MGTRLLPSVAEHLGPREAQGGDLCRGSCSRERAVLLSGRRLVVGLKFTARSRFWVCLHVGIKFSQESSGEMMIRISF